MVALLLVSVTVSRHSYHIRPSQYGVHDLARVFYAGCYYFRGNSILVVHGSYPSHNLDSIMAGIRASTYKWTYERRIGQPSQQALSRGKDQSGICLDSLGKQFSYCLYPFLVNRDIDRQIIA